MSEYRYYEFQALDRPLTQHEMHEQRKYSTRATITANTSSLIEDVISRPDGDVFVCLDPASHERTIIGCPPGASRSAIQNAQTRW
jgi:hypothetical protein